MLQRPESSLRLQDFVISWINSTLHVSLCPLIRSVPIAITFLIYIRCLLRTFRIIFPFIQLYVLQDCQKFSINIFIAIREYDRRRKATRQMQIIQSSICLDFNVRSERNELVFVYAYLINWCWYMIDIRYLNIYVL